MELTINRISQGNYKQGARNWLALDYTDIERARQSSRKINEWATGQELPEFELYRDKGRIWVPNELKNNILSFLETENLTPDKSFTSAIVIQQIQGIIKEGQNEEELQDPVIQENDYIYTYNSLIYNPNLKDSLDYAGESGWIVTVEKGRKKVDISISGGTKFTTPDGKSFVNKPAKSEGYDKNEVEWNMNNWFDISPLTEEDEFIFDEPWDVQHDLDDAIESAKKYLEESEKAKNKPISPETEKWLERWHKRSSLEVEAWGGGGVNDVLLNSVLDRVESGEKKVPYGRRVRIREYSIDEDWILHCILYQTEVVTADVKNKKLIRTTRGGWSSGITNAEISGILSILKDRGWDIPRYKDYEYNVNEGVPEKDIKMLDAEDDETNPERLRELADDPDENIRKLVAKNSNTPPEILQELAWDKSRWVVYATIDNASLPISVRTDLAVIDDVGIRSRVAISYYTPLALKKKLAKDPDEQVRIAMVRKVDDKIIREILARDESPLVRYYLDIGRKWHPSEELDKYSESPDEKIRMRVAKHSDTSTETKQKLARDPSRKVRMALFENPKMSIETLKILATDEDYDIKKKVIEWNWLTEDILEILSNDKDPTIRYFVADNTKTPSSILDKLSKDEEALIRRRVAGNYNTPKEVLLRLAQDTDERIRMTVANNNNTDKNALWILSRDPNREIKDIANQKLSELGLIPKPQSETEKWLERWHKKSGLDKQSDYFDKYYYKDSRYMPGTRQYNIDELEHELEHYAVEAWKKRGLSRDTIIEEKLPELYENMKKWHWNQKIEIGNNYYNEAMKGTRFEKESEYSVSSPKTPRMQEYHKKLEKDLLKTPKIEKESSESEGIIITAQEVEEEIKPLKNVDKLVQLTKDIDNLVSGMPEEFHMGRHGHGGGSDYHAKEGYDWYEFNIKMHGYDFRADWMDDYTISDDLWWNELHISLENIVEGLKEKYDWIEDWFQAGRMGGWLVLQSDGLVARSEEWVNSTHTEESDIQRYYDQRDINEAIKEGQSLKKELIKRQIDLEDTEIYIERGIRETAEMFKDIEFWRRRGIEIPRLPGEKPKPISPETERWLERWHRRGSIIKTSDEPKHEGKKPLIFWDESEMIDNEIEYIKGEGLEEHEYVIEHAGDEYMKIWEKYKDLEYPQSVKGFWAELKNKGMDSKLEKTIQNSVYEDTDIFNFWAEDFYNYLDEIIKERNPDGHWFASGEEMGWRSRSGHKFFEAKDSHKFMEALTGRLSEFTFYMYEHEEGGTKGFSITLSHHDAPTGENYYVYPIGRQYETLNDASEIDERLEEGDTQIWYVKQVPTIRTDELIQHIDVEHLDKTHVHLGNIRGAAPEMIFALMQGEHWSPKGEARKLIMESGLMHTSMMIGDIIVLPDGKVLMAELEGFKRLTKEKPPTETERWLERWYRRGSMDKKAVWSVLDKQTGSYLESGTNSPTLREAVEACFDFLTSGPEFEDMEEPDPEQMTWQEKKRFCEEYDFEFVEEWIGFQDGDKVRVKSGEYLVLPEDKEVEVGQTMIGTIDISYSDEFFREYGVKVGNDIYIVPELNIQLIKDEQSEVTEKWLEKWHRKGSINKKSEYENLTTQTSDVPQELVDQIKDIQSGIDKSILIDTEDEKGWVSNGLQQLFHIALLYGVKPKDKDRISETVKEFMDSNEVSARTGDIEYFDNKDEGHTAIVLRVESDGLKELHNKLKEEFDNEDKYPEYKPHVCIAYIKLGERLDDVTIKPVEWQVDKIEMSGKDGGLTKISEEQLTVIIQELPSSQKAIDRLEPLPPMWFENDDEEKYVPTQEEIMHGYDMQDKGKNYKFTHFIGPQVHEEIFEGNDYMMSFNNTINCIEPIVLYLILERGWKLTDAITIAAHSCERCLNILLEDVTGEFYDERDKFPHTHCDLCAVIDPEYDKRYKQYEKEREENNIGSDPMAIIKESVIVVHDRENNRNLIVDESKGGCQVVGEDVEIIKVKAMAMYKYFSKKFTRKAQVEEFKSGMFVIFTQDSSFKMDQLDAMGEIKKNMIGKVNKVLDNAVLIEIGRQIYEIPFIEAFKVVEPFRAKVVPPEEAGMPETPKESVETPLESTEPSAETPEGEERPVRPEISMERGMTPVPIRPKKPLEKALEVETVLKNMMRRMAIIDTRTQLKEGDPIIVNLEGRKYSGNISGSLGKDYKVKLSDGRIIIVPIEWLELPVSVEPKKEIPKVIPKETPKVEEPKGIPIGSRVMVVMRPQDQYSPISLGELKKIKDGKYFIRQDTGNVIEADESQVSLMSLPKEKKPKTRKEFPYPLYRYSKEGLAPIYPKDDVPKGTFVYVRKRGVYELGEVIEQENDMLGIELFAEDTKDYYSRNITFYAEMPLKLREKMLEKFTDWSTETEAKMFGKIIVSEMKLAVRTRPEILDTLTTHYSDIIRQQVAQDPEVMPETLTKMINDKDVNVRDIVAKNPKTPPEALARMMRDKVDVVRESVILNPSTPMETKLKAIKDESDTVRETLAEQPNLPIEALQELAKDENEGVRSSVAFNKNTPIELLNELSKDFSKVVRWYVANNPNTPQEILQSLVQDKYPLVSSKAKEKLGIAETGIISQKIIVADEEHIDMIKKAEDLTTEQVYDSLKRHFAEAGEIIKFNSEGRYGNKGDAGEFQVGDTLYNWIISEDEAEKIATERVKEDLEDQPEIFNQNWLQSFITMTDTDRRIIADEEADAKMDGMGEGDIISEMGVESEIDETTNAMSELEDKGKSDTPKYKKLKQETEKIIEKAKEDLQEKYYNEIYNNLNDPIQYFVHDQGIYSVEDLIKQSWISIDTNEAAEDAVNTDGWAHFLSDDDDYDTTSEGVVFFIEDKSVREVTELEIDLPVTEEEKKKKQKEETERWLERWHKKSGVDIEKLKSIVEQTDAIWQGIQHTGEGYEDLVTLVNPKTMSLKALPISEVTIENIKKKLASVQEDRMNRIILGQTEINDQMLDENDMWLSRELWEPKVKQYSDAIEELLGQAERGINVISQIQSYLESLEEVLGKIPHDQLVSAGEYIDKFLSQPKKSFILSRIITADIERGKIPLKELNKIMKKRDKEYVTMDKKDNKEKINEPDRPNINPDINLGGTTRFQSMRSRMIKKATKFGAGDKVEVIKGIFAGSVGIVKEMGPYDFHNPIPTYRVRFTDKQGNWEYRWYEETEIKPVEMGFKAPEPEPIKSPEPVTVASSEFDATIADISSGFKLLLNEIEQSSNPYVVRDIGKRLYNKEKDGGVVREGNVSRIGLRKK